MTMKFENGIMNEPVSDPHENIRRYRALARQLEKMSPTDRDEVFRWLERYKTDVQKNPAVLLEATEIVMGMIAESRKRESAAQKKGDASSQPEIDPVLLDQRWTAFQLEMQYEGLEMAHEDMTDKKLLESKKDVGEWGPYESHGKRGRK
jgi:hypothetical protein